MLLHRKHSGNGIKEPNQLKRSIIFRAELRMWCQNTSPTHQKSQLCEAMRSTPAGVEISQGPVKAGPAVRGVLPPQDFTGHFRKAKTEWDTLSSLKHLQGRDGHSDTHLHPTPSNTFQAVFRPRKLSSVKLWWSMGQKWVVDICSCQHKLPGFSWGWWTPRLRTLQFLLAQRWVWPELGSYLQVGAVGSSSLTHFRALTCCWFKLL